MNEQLHATMDGDTVTGLRNNLGITNKKMGLDICSNVRSDCKENTSDEKSVRTGRIDAHLPHPLTATRNQQLLEDSDRPSGHIYVTMLILSVNTFESLE